MAAAAKGLRTLLRHPAYMRMQMKPVYSIAGTRKDVELADVLRAVHSLEGVLKVPENGPVKDLERRIAKLESLVSLGGIVVGAMLAYTFVQPVSMYKLEQADVNMDMRVGYIENHLQVSATPSGSTPSRRVG